MNDFEQQSARLHFVEDIGLAFERAGLPRMAGRILGWLLICDPSHQSPGQLAEALQASKGSISSMTRLLLQIGLIERISLPGQRRDYFRIKSNSWTEIFRQRMLMVSTLRKLADQGLQLLADQSPQQRQRLEEMRDLYAFFEHEVPLLLARWECERAERGQPEDS